MTAGRLCSRIMATASPDETIRAAARRMAEFDVGTLVVLKENRGSHAVGVITDRDVAIRCVAEQLNPDEALVSEVMTTPVYSVSDDTPLEDAITKMAAAGTRRLVVTGEGNRVAGILSLDDVLDMIVRQTTAIGRLLEKQQPKIPA